MGILLHEACVEADAFHELSYSFSQIIFEIPQVQARSLLAANVEEGALAESFCQGGVDRHSWIERGIRVLEHHLKVESARPDFTSAQRAQIISVQGDLSGVSRLKLHDRSGEGRFSASRFAYEAENLPLLHTQSHSIDRTDHIRGPTEASFPDGEVGMNVDKLKKGHVRMKALIQEWDILNLRNLK